MADLDKAPIDVRWRLATPDDADLVWRSLYGDRRDPASRDGFLGRFDPDRFRIIVSDNVAVGACRLVAGDPSLLVIDGLGFPEEDTRSATGGVIGLARSEAAERGQTLHWRIARDEAERRRAESLGFSVSETTTTEWGMVDRSSDDERFMMEALKEAALAADEGEAPVGAVITRDGAVIACGRNACEATGDPTLHAEVVAIRAAATALGDQRLTGCELHVTVEPCAMCCGALLLARIDRVVFGAVNEKFGACGSLCDLLSDDHWTHRVAWRGGVCEGEAADLMRLFFVERRAGDNT